MEEQRIISPEFLSLAQSWKMQASALGDVKKVLESLPEVELNAMHCNLGTQSIDELTHLIASAIYTIFISKSVLRRLHVCS